MKDFFCSNILIEDIDLILSELKNKFLSKFINKNFGFNNIDIKELTDCPIISKWISSNNLILRAIAIINIPKQYKQNIHIDWNEFTSNDKISTFNKSNIDHIDETITYALNFNLYNCENSTTYMFCQHNKKETLKFNSNKLPFYAFSPNDVSLKTSFILKNVILLNVGVPHQVVNETEDQRISLSLRFNKINLLKFNTKS